MPTDVEMLVTRLARMKALIKELEKECSESDKHRAVFFRLRDELKAARQALKPAKRNK